MRLYPITQRKAASKLRRAGAPQHGVAAGPRAHLDVIYFR